MTENVDRAEQDRVRARNFATMQGVSPDAAEEFAFEYVAVIEDRLYEQRYPDAPLPTPEEVWLS